MSTYMFLSWNIILWNYINNLAILIGWKHNTWVMQRLSLHVYIVQATSYQPHKGAQVYNTILNS